MTENARQRDESLFAEGRLEKANGSLPLVSVHMIVWNGEKYIAEAIESVLGQTYRNFELVIVDDGSTDRTREIIEAFKSDRIRYARKEHSGGVPTRNRARSLCRGDFIVFVDADDLCDPRLLEIEVQTLLDHPDIDVVYTNLSIIDERGKETGETWTYRDYEPKELIAALFRRGQNVTSSGSMMFTKKISDRVGEFDENFFVSFDSDFIARLARHGRFKHIDLPLYRYRHHGSNISRADKSMKERARSTALMLNKMLALFTPEELCPEIPFRELSAEKAESAFHLYVAGVFWSHCRAFLQSGYYLDLLRKAETHTARCLAINPNHRGAGALMKEIQSLLRMEGPASAKQMTANTLRRGETLFAEGRLEEAESCFLSIGEDDPGYPESCNNLGVIAFQQGRPEEAVECFSRALAGDIFHREALLNLADALRVLGRLSGIVPSLEAFHRRDPDDEAIAELLKEARGSLPLVSVHMIVWNGEKYIAEAIESVLGQTYRNFELVIVDDGSTDRTREIVEGFRSDRIRYAWKEHSGVAPTRNLARSLCRGDFIVFIDSDDLCDPRMLEIEVQTLLDHPGIDAVYTNLNIIDEKGKEKKEVWQFRDYEPGELIATLFHLGRNVIPFPTMMLRREISDRVGDCDERFIVSFDSDYIMRLARYGRFKHIALPLYKYRLHEGNISRFDKSMKERARSAVLMLNKMLALFTPEELCPEIPWKVLAPEKAEAEFHCRVGTIFRDHCRAFFQGGHYRDLLREAEVHIAKCLAADPDHGGGKALMEDVQVLSAVGSAAPVKPVSRKKRTKKRSPLRLLYLADSKSQHTKRYVRFFRDRGHDVHLFDTSGDTKDLEGVTLHTPVIPTPDIPPLKTEDPFLHTVLSLHRVIDDIKPHILHGHYLRGWCWWGVFTGFQPFVTTAWGSDVYLEPNQPYIKRLTSFCLKESCLVTADSMDLLEATANLRGFRDGLRYVPFGIDTDFFRPGYDVSDLAKKLGINGSRVVFSPRQFKPEANIHVLIKAIPKVLQKMPDTLFILKTYLTDDPACSAYEGYLRKLVRENGLEKQVLFIKDVPFGDMPLLYNLADVMVTLRDTDGSSCSMLEAMACRTPIVVSDIESMREWVKDRENGRIVNHHNPDAVADAILSILADGETRKKFTDAGYTLVKERADYRTGWTAVEENYYELIEGSGGTIGPETADPCGDLLRTGWRFVDSGRPDRGKTAFSMVLNLQELPMQYHLKALLGLGKIAWMHGNWETMESHYVNAMKLLFNFDLEAPLTINMKGS